MTMNSTTGLMTIGGTGTFVDNSYYPFVHPQTVGNDWPTYGYIYTNPTPYQCDGNVHVFGCDHAAKCKCGKTSRKPEPPKCAHCGKAHG
jgi:hypothetical protein